MREHLVSFLVCAATAASMLTLAGCGKKPQPPEPIRPAEPIPLNHFVRSWHFNVDLEQGDAIKSLHVRENDLFVYTRSGQIQAMGRDTGRLAWIAQIRSTDRGGMRPPVMLKDFVAVPTSSTLELYEPKEGSFIRSIALKVAARSNAVGMENMVYLGGDYASSGRVVALDVTKEYVHTVWQLMIARGGLESTPALHKDTLYIGGGDGNVYAVAALNREALWPLKDGAFKTEGPIVADVVADDLGVYVASTDSRFYCLNPQTGRLNWQFYGGVALTEDPVLTPSLVYLPVPGTGIAAFKKGRNDGEFNRSPFWLAHGMVQFLAEDDKLVYMRRAGDNVIVAIDKQTGEQRFESTRRDLVVFATNRKPDGVIFAASKTNRILAIKPVLRPGVTGELVWNEQDAMPEGQQDDDRSLAFGSALTVPN